MKNTLSAGRKIVTRCYSLTPVRIPEALVSEFEERCTALDHVIKFKIGHHDLINIGDMEKYRDQMIQLSKGSVGNAASDLVKIIQKSSDPEYKNMRDEMDFFKSNSDRSVVVFSGLPMRSMAHTDFFTRILCEAMGFSPFYFAQNHHNLERSDPIANENSSLPLHNDYRFRRSDVKPDLVTLTCLNRINLESNSIETLFIPAATIYDALSPKHREILSAPIISYVGKLQNDGLSEANTEPEGIFYTNKRTGKLCICYDRTITNLALSRFSEVVSTDIYSRPEIQSALFTLDQTLEELLQNKNLIYAHDLQPGDMMSFYNYQGLHARLEKIPTGSRRTLLHNLHSIKQLSPKSQEPSPSI